MKLFSRWWEIKHLNILSEFPLANIWTSEHSWRGKILSRKEHRTSLSPPKKFGSSKNIQGRQFQVLQGQVYLFRNNTKIKLHRIYQQCIDPDGIMNFRDALKELGLRNTINVFWTQFKNLGLDKNDKVKNWVITWWSWEDM